MFQAIRRILARTGRTTLASITVATCSNAPNLKQLDLKQDPAMFSHKYLLQQASSVVASSTFQLLTQSVVAMMDTVEKYRGAVLDLIQLLETREHVRGADGDELSELITGSRLKANDLKSELLELQAFMEYVEKLVVSATETSFLIGAEYCSTCLSEVLYSAQLQIKESIKNVEDLETDLIALQERIISDTK